MGEVLNLLENWYGVHPVDANQNGGLAVANLSVRRTPHEQENTGIDGDAPAIIGFD